MLNNTAFLKINKLLLIFILLVTSCSKERTSLKGVESIITKRTLLNYKNVEHAYSSNFEFLSDFYPIDKEIHFNSKGYIDSIGGAKAEGLLYYYRNAKTMQLPLEGNDLNYEIKLDTINNFIIDNKDTIRDFKVNIKEGVIYTSPNSNNRFYVYEFI